jgi:hypothetical protein
VLSTKISAQLEIKFSEASKEFKNAKRFYPGSKNEFYTAGVVTSPSIYAEIVKYKNFQKTSANKVKLGAVSKKRLTDNALINGQLVGFYSDEISDGKGKSDVLFVEKYNNDCLPDGSPKELLKIEIQKEWNIGYRPFTITSSANGDFFCVDYEIKTKEKNNNQYVYKVVTKDFKVISEGKYEVPYADQDVEDVERYVSNTGDYFISYRVYQYDEKRKMKIVDAFQKVVVMQIKNNSVVERAMEFGDQRAMQMTYSSDADGIMTITGVYGLKSEKVGKGIFFLKYDFKNNTVIQSEYATFAEKGLDASTRKYEFKFKNMITLADGSLLGSFELYQNELKMHKEGGFISYYYYDDVITYKINSKGSFDWFNQMHKMHISANDYGFVSSAFTFVKKDKLIVMFNDHFENYDASGNYTTERNYVKFSKKTNVVAYTEIDLETGRSLRKLALSPETKNQYAVPKMFQYDAKTKLVWMVFQPDRKNFQFASLEL